MKRKHGLSRTSKSYHRWNHMIRRCCISKSKDFHNYGGRGIRVCDEWRNSFTAFLADMGEPPFPKAEIDRIDNNGPYSKENCRWTTHKENSRNMRTTHYLTYNGERASLSYWAEKFGLKATQLYNRIIRHWSIERALTQPLEHHDAVAPSVREAMDRENRKRNAKRKLLRAAN